MGSSLSLLTKESLGLKQILCFGQPDPTYQNQPTLDFFMKKTFFFVGVFIIEVSILKKTKQQQTNRADLT